MITESSTAKVTRLELPQAGSSTITTDAFAGEPFVESFRLLALQVNRLLGPGERRSVAVLSAEPDDGRSLTAACLAAALAEVAPPILLMNADPTGSGLSDLIMPRPFSDEVLNANSVTRYRHDPPRAALRGQQRFLEHVCWYIEEACTSGLLVVIDTPPCLISSVAFALAASAGGVIYVVRRRVRAQRVHEEIRAQLDGINARVLGLVFNEG